MPHQAAQATIRAIGSEAYRRQNGNIHITTSPVLARVENGKGLKWRSSAVDRVYTLRPYGSHSVTRLSWKVESKYFVMEVEKRNFIVPFSAAVWK
jgi:hypothetical protein